MKIDKFNHIHYTEQDKKIIDINTLAARIYHKILVSEPVGKKALAYLHGRQVSDKVINDYQLGFAPKSSALLKTLRKHGFTDSQLTATGLFTRGKRNGVYDYFFNRVIYPIRDHEGHVIAFSGRVLNKTDSPAKYLNIKETALFHKGQTIFNLDKAKDSIKRHDQVILVEGYMDVLSSYQAGVKNVIASMGTGLTKQQIQILKRYTHNVTVCYDGDTPGQDAIARALGMFANKGIARHVIQMPAGIDPDEYRRKYGDQAYRKYVASNVELPIIFDLKHASAKLNLKTIYGQIQYLKKAIHILADMKPNEFVDAQQITAVRDTLIIDLACQFNVAPKHFYQDIANLKAQRAKHAGYGKPSKDKLELNEQMFIHAMLKNPQYAKLMDPVKIGMTPAYIELFNIIKFYYRKHGKITAKGVSFIASKDHLSSDYQASASLKDAPADKASISRYINNIHRYNAAEYWLKHNYEHFTEALELGDYNHSRYYGDFLASALKQIKAARN